MSFQEDKEALLKIIKDSGITKAAMIKAGANFSEENELQIGNDKEFTEAIEIYLKVSNRRL